WLGDALLSLGALDSAESIYQRTLALESDPQPAIQHGVSTGLSVITQTRAMASTLLTQGDTHYQEKEYEEALSLYKQAALVYPGWVSAYLRLGDTYEKTKDKPSAYAAYHRAILLQPGLLGG